MDYPIQIIWTCPLKKLKELPVKISINGILLFLNTVVIVTNSADHNEMPPCAAFHLCLHLFPLDSRTCMYKNDKDFIGCPISISLDVKMISTIYLYEPVQNVTRKSPDSV